MNILTKRAQQRTSLRIYHGLGATSVSCGPRQNDRSRPHHGIDYGDDRGLALVEDPGGDLQVRANAFSFDLRPYEIKTFRLRLDTR
jgi:hypothetical protein